MSEVRFHPHALQRLSERGATEQELTATIREGEQFPAKYGRTGFRRNFLYQEIWQGKVYAYKQIEAYAVFEDSAWLVITVIVKYF